MHRHRSTVIRSGAGIHLFGTFDFVTGTGRSDYRGEVCIASRRATEKTR